MIGLEWRRSIAIWRGCGELGQKTSCVKDLLLSTRGAVGVPKESRIKATYQWNVSQFCNNSTTNLRQHMKFGKKDAPKLKSNKERIPLLSVWLHKPFYRTSPTHLAVSAVEDIPRRQMMTWPSGKAILGYNASSCNRDVTEWLYRIFLPLSWVIVRCKKNKINKRWNEDGWYDEMVQGRFSFRFVVYVTRQKKYC